MTSSEVKSQSSAGSSNFVCFNVEGPQGNVGADQHGRTPTLTNKKKKLRAPICVKLTLFICLSVMVASGVPELVLWKKVHQQLVGQIEHRLMTVSTLRQEQLKDYLFSEADKTQLISIRVLIYNYLSNITAGNRTVATSDLEGAVSVISDFKHAAIYNTKGRLVLATDEYVFQPQIQETYVNSITRDTPKLQFPVQTPEGWTYIISRGIFKDSSRLSDNISHYTSLGEVLLMEDFNGRTQSRQCEIYDMEQPEIMRALDAEDMGVSRLSADGDRTILDMVDIFSSLAAGTISLL
ncbi:hypothetical protein L7F22_033597 [Adiantum nelumboides]|nr:hypothetical protein [Adiantum nelumboides]